MENDNVITSFLDRRWAQLRGFSRVSMTDCPVIWIGTAKRHPMFNTPEYFAAIKERQERERQQQNDDAKNNPKQRRF